MDGKFLAWRAYEEGEDRGVILSGDETVSRSVRYSIETSFDLRSKFTRRSPNVLFGIGSAHCGIF